MNDEPRESHLPAAAPREDAPPALTSAPAGEVQPTKQLTPEEQMALFEQELKETDWGHQPC